MFGSSNEFSVELARYGIFTSSMSGFGEDRMPGVRISVSSLDKKNMEMMYDRLNAFNQQYKEKFVSLS